MKSTFFYITIVFSFLCCIHTMQSQATALTPKEAQALINNKNIQIIDVRTEEEFQETHIDKAININFFSEDFFNNIQKLDKEKPLLVYCRSGKRSANSIEQFTKAEFTTIYTLEGGLISWKAAGFNLWTP